MASSEIEATSCPSTWPTNLLSYREEHINCNQAQFPALDLSARLEVHNAGQGAIYTKSRRPVALVYSAPHSGKAEAITREKQIKRWSKAKKRALIDGRLDVLHTLAKRQDV